MFSLSRKQILKNIYIKTCGRKDLDDYEDDDYYYEEDTWNYLDQCFEVSQ